MKLNVSFASRQTRPVSVQLGKPPSGSRVKTQTQSPWTVCFSLIRHKAGNNMNLKLVRRFHAAE